MVAMSSEKELEKLWRQNNFIQYLSGDSGIIHDEIIKCYGIPYYVYPKTAIWDFPIFFKKSSKYILIRLNKRELSIRCYIYWGGSYSTEFYRNFKNLNEILEYKNFDDFFRKILKEEKLGLEE